MKHVTALALASVTLVSTAMSQTTTTTTKSAPKNIYNDQIQIKTDDGKVMAIIGTDGKTVLGSGCSYDDVINTLILRMVVQNKQYQEQMASAAKLIDDARSRASATIRKSRDIEQIWNPTTTQPVQAPAPTKEDIVKTVNIVPDKKVVAAPVPVVPAKKSLMSKLLGE